MEKPVTEGSKSDLTLEHYHSDMGKLEATIANYEKMQRVKGFTGVPSKLLKSLARQEGSDWKFSHYIARVEMYLVIMNGQVLS